MIGLAAALGMALAAQAQRPLRADCIDIRPMFAEVSLTGQIVPRIVERPLIGLNGERNPPPAVIYDLLLDPAICVDDGHLADPDVRLVRAGLYTSDRAIVPQVHNAGRRRVRIHGRAFTSFSADGYRPIMVVNVQAIEAADR